MKWPFCMTQKETVDQLLDSREALLPRDLFFAHHLSGKLNQGRGLKERERRHADKIIKRL